jgi:hypothetical protein
LNDALTDVHEPLRYGRGKMNRKWLALGVLLLAIGAVFAHIRPGSFTIYDWFMTAFSIALGAFMTLYALFRTLFPGKPLLELSPAGLRLHIEWVKDVLIPWHEVRGVETIDVTGRVRGQTVYLPGVTAVLVSRPFYDRHIHVNSWLLRGPGWDTNFIPKDSMVQIALHHQALPVGAQELRAAVEARWRAFRGDDGAADSRT